jgi:hypothetical protein
MNPRATKQADDIFYARHPELVESPGGKRRPLTMSPADRDLRQEWLQIYKEADEADKKGFAACDVGGAVLPCQAAAAPAPTPAPPAPASPPPAPASPPPAPAQPAPKPCKIEVRANKLSSLGFYHMFIVFTNAAGQEYYLRGGPSGGGVGMSRSSGEISGGASNSGSQGASGSGSNPSAASDSSGGTGTGPYGDIVTEYGKYEPGTIDWEPGAKSVTIANSTEACAKDTALIAQMDAITASHTRYNPLGPNSNSTVYTALSNVGLTPAVPDGVRAPGKDVPITVAGP